MKAYDFEYDGITLSSLGYIICKFNYSNIDTINNGSQITFNTVSINNGKKRHLTHLTYDECLESTFQICKNPCDSTNNVISVDEVRKLSRWLNRNEFHKFRLLNDEMINFYFEASFNINRIEMHGDIIGLELTMITNSPFALMKEKRISINNTQVNGIHHIVDLSDVEGSIYPKMSIKIKQNGDLSITNEFENKIMVIKNCKIGETITIEYPMIESSLSSHDIANDFNWNFFRITNKYMKNLNKLVISIPCDIEIKYSPYVKFSA